MFFEKMVIAKFLGIACYENLIEFICEEVRTDEIFAVKKEYPDLFGCSMHDGIQFVCIETGVKCTHYEKRTFFSIEIEGLAKLFLKKCFLQLCQKTP